MDVGSKIAKLRASKGWSQSQLADQLGVSEGSVKDWESGDSVPSSAKIEAIASALGVEADYLAPGGAKPQQQTENNDSVPAPNAMPPYGGYRMARDEMRMERDEMRYSGGKSSVLFVVYWIAAVAIYLAVSYFTHAWSWTWIILAVAAAAFYPIMNSQKK